MRLILWRMCWILYCPVKIPGNCNPLPARLLYKINPERQMWNFLHMRALEFMIICVLYVYGGQKGDAVTCHFILP